MLDVTHCRISWHYSMDAGDLNFFLYHCSDFLTWALIYCQTIVSQSVILLNKMLSIHRIYQKDLKTFMFFMVFARFQSSSYFLLNKTYTFHKHFKVLYFILPPCCFVMFPVLISHTFLTVCSFWMFLNVLMTLLTH